MLLQGEIIYNHSDIAFVKKKLVLLILNGKCVLYKLINKKYKLCKLPNHFEFVDVINNVKIICECGCVKIVNECIIPYPVGITGYTGPVGKVGETGPGGVEQLAQWV